MSIRTARGPEATDAALALGELLDLRELELGNGQHDELRHRVADRFADRFEPVRLLIPYADGARLAELYALGAPVDERADRPEGVFVRARLPRSEVRRFAPYLLAEPRRASARKRA